MHLRGLAAFCQHAQKPTTCSRHAPCLGAELGRRDAFALAHRRRFKSSSILTGVARWHHPCGLHRAATFPSDLNPGNKRGPTVTKLGHVRIHLQPDLVLQRELPQECHRALLHVLCHCQSPHRVPFQLDRTKQLKRTFLIGRRTFSGCASFRAFHSALAANSDGTNELGLPVRTNSTYELSALQRLTESSCLNMSQHKFGQLLYHLPERFQLIISSAVATLVAPISSSPSTIVVVPVVAAVPLIPGHGPWMTFRVHRTASPLPFHPVCVGPSVFVQCIFILTRGCIGSCLLEG
eukprot:s1979_g14.t1